MAKTKFKTLRVRKVHEHVKDMIVVIRDHRVMLDRDLAALYGVTTKRINEQMKRNRSRFPEGLS